MDLVKEVAEPIGIGIVVAVAALVINIVLGALGFAPLATVGFNSFNVTPQGIVGLVAAFWGVGKAAQWAPEWVRNALKTVAR